MEIKFIFFDFGGTIDSDGIHWRKRAYPLYLKHGINISYDEFSKAFFDADDNLHIRHNLKNSGFDETVRYQVADLLEYLKINNRDLVEKISSEFINDARKKVEENIPLFQYLKSKKIKLGIISNFYGNLIKVLQSLNISEYFDIVTDSGVIGHIKPSKEIFIHAINAINADPLKSAMVGDAYHRDIAGAHNIGMYHFYVNPENDKKPCCERFINIKNIRELMKYV